MGLDAVVFKSAARMENEFGRKGFNVDLKTGEAIPVAGSGPEISLAAATSLCKRLGNIDEMDGLRKIISQILPAENSIGLRRILYSASHSGDAVHPNDFPRLREELRILTARRQHELAGFIRDMEELLAAAEAEGNPIAFV